MGYIFDKVNHVHTLDGKRLWGVTTILGSWGDPGGLINWAANTAVDAMVGGATEEDARVAHTKKRDKAGDKGTAVHNALEVSLKDWITKGQMSLTGDKVIDNVLEYFRANDITPIKSELNVYSRTFWFGGIFDAVVEKDNKRYVLDFKTSGTLQEKAFLQCGAYSLAIKEMKPDAEIGGVVIIHIPKGTSFNPEKNVYWHHNVTELELGFIHVLNVYKLCTELKKKINVFKPKKK